MNDIFYKSYIQNFTVSSIKRQVDFANKKIFSLKTKKGKDDYVVLLYSGYLQIIENLLIFLLITNHENGIENLFELHQKLYTNLKELLDIDKDSPKLGRKGKSFLEELISQIFFQPIDKLYPYKKLIEEAIEDYFYDKDFLNAYKHGMRLSSGGESNIYLSGSGTNASFQIGNYDSSIRYYLKKKEQEKEIIYQNTVAFNYEYITVKTSFIESFIESYKLHILNSGKEIKIEQLFINNDSIYEKYGIGRFKTPIFEKPLYNLKHKSKKCTNIP